MYHFGVARYIEEQILPGTYSSFFVKMPFFFFGMQSLINL
jgi:hypothetical protein